MYPGLDCFVLEMDTAMMAFITAHLGKIISYVQMLTAMTNMVYRVVNADNQEYLVKFYGRTPTRAHKSFYNTLAESLVDMEQESIWAKFLAEQGVGPIIVKSEPIGRIEEYLVNIKSVSGAMMHDAGVVKMVVDAIAKFHSLPIDQWRAPENVILWRRMDAWREKVDFAMQQPELAADAELMQMLVEADAMFAGRKRFVQDRLQIARHAAHISLCHNDLQHGNVLIQDAKIDGESREVVRIVDYDYVGINYAAFDLANYFCEWGFDYNGPVEESWRMNRSLYPSRATQTEVLMYYLERHFGMTSFGTGVIDEWLSMIDLMVPLVNLGWGYWLIVKSASEFDTPPETVSFDYLAGAKERLKLFLEWNRT